jgi:hypothetical protein
MRGWLHRASFVALAAAALLAAGCGASGDEGTSPTTEPASGSGSTDGTADAGDGPAGGSAPGTFGDLEAVCGPGDARVAAAEAGRGTDRLYLGVATDRKATIRPGLNREMWDTSVAFAQWCNEAGGIAGLPVELVELDGSVLQVEQAMTTACRDVFAMVGGGFVQDDLQFSGRDGSDFHRCGLVDVPGYAVSAQKTDSNGQVQPVPNQGTTVTTDWLRDFAELEPRQAAEVAIAYGELPALEIQRAKYEAAVEDVGLDLAGTFPYPVTGMTDWTPLARSIIDSGATTLLFVGEPGNLANLLAKLREQRWKGTPLLETNAYDPLLFSAGDAAVEGALVRSYVQPFEEARDGSATRQYLDLVAGVADDAKVSPLGVLSMSAWLLFARAATGCAEEGPITRTCVLEQAAAQEDWTAGGLHAPTDPARFDEVVPSTCGMLVVARDGRFERRWPRVGGPDDDGDGFACRPAEEAVTSVPANRGKGVVDPDRPL